MEDQIRDKIAEAVHADFDWKTSEVRVDEVERLRRGSCSFYTAAHKVRPLSYQPNYAVLSDSTVIGGDDDKAIAKIIDSCGGTDASAAWWAEIVSRFHPDLGGVVLEDETENAAAVRKVRSLGKEFAPPVLSGDASNKAVTFYMLDPESFVIYAVKATRKTDGTVVVNKTELS